MGLPASKTEPAPTPRAITPAAAPAETAEAIGASRALAGDLLRAILVPAALVVLWEIGSRTGVLNRTFIPPPSTVAATWYNWIFGTPTAGGTIYSGTWLDHSLSSARRVLLGFVIAAAIGTSLGVLIGWFRAVAVLLDPLIQTLRPIPITAWLPFAVVFWGIHEGGAVSLIALGAFFPIVVNATAGAARTPRVLVRAALMLGTRPGKLLWRVVLPAALPSIFTGLRLGVGVAWVLVIVSEMIAVKSGLGYVLWDAYFFIRMDMIIAAMFSVGILGFLSDAVIVLVRNQVLAYSRGLFYA
jgi:NitT/TauT family transport system permease protein